jgi:serralysin
MKTKSKTKPVAKILRVCVDRPSSFLDLHRKMYQSIRHNPKNNPAAKGTEEHAIVTRFLENPHQNFSPEHSATLSRLALVTDSKWQKGTTITISFLDGSSVQKKKTKKYARYWISKANANLKLKFITGKKGMIRISFVADPGSWSVIGTECLSLPVNEPTMNFGWLRNDTGDDEYERVVVHEFGHALGCIHEHQSPAGGIHWNKPAVYQYYQGPPNNWTKSEVDSNIFQTYAKSQTQFTQLDPNSIMMYPIPKQFTTNGFSVGMNLQLSPVDKSFIQKQYPA